MTDIATAKTKNIIPRDQLTQEYLKQRLSLDEATGYFYLNEDTKLGRKGDFAGSIRAADSYYSLVLAGVVYSGKLLAHFYKEGKWPEKEAKTKVEKEVKPREVRKPPVITEEAIAKAKAEMAAKKAALKEKKQNQETVKPAVQENQTNPIEDSDF